MTIRDILESMEYGPAPESGAEVQSWLDGRARAFGHFIAGTFTAPGEGFESRNPANGALLARVSQASQADIDAAVAAARAAQPGWAALGGHRRARVLYALARLLQKHSRLFAVLETLDNGKPIRESRDIDIPLAARHFYYHAGMAQLMEEELPDRAPLGVCGQIIPWNFPLLMLAWKIAPAIAMGNSVVLKPAEYTPLTALLFGQICQEAGVPAGVVNIVTGDGAAGERLVAAPVDKIAFTGSTAVGRAIRKATAGSGKALTLELGGKSPYIVFEDADLDSAVEGLVDAIWFNQGQVCCAGSRLLVQEGIADRFHDKLRARMDALRLGDPLDKCIDVGALVDPVQLATVKRFVDEGAGAGEIYQPDVALPEGCFYPPTLITGLAPADRLMQEEIFGPVLVSTTFRTPAEAVQIANDTRYGLAATLWSENINLALDVAPKLAAGVVWVNATNLFDAAAGFGGVRESGFGREGGWEGLLAYTRSAEAPARARPLAPFAAPEAPAPDDPLDRTAKMYVGGKQARPDSGYSRAVWSPAGVLLGHVGSGNRKDIRNAVEAAHKAAGWSRTTGHLRAQILFYIAENLSARAAEFAARIDAMTGGSGGAGEVEAAIDLLFTHAAWADKHDGAVKPVPLRGLAVAVNEPVGIIGAICPPDRPLLGLVAAMAPAVAMGNRVVLVPSEAFPLAATDFYQVLETSDVPAGVVNIVTGAQDALAADLATHLNVDAVWNLSTGDLDATIERAAAGNLKRTWCTGIGDTPASREALAAATEVKTIWVPYGV
ncbi:aldehyde dehydrogenase family protein [Tropicimonas sp. IMCC6043]|uniref:aldehyde dehydrogenase family protein n=1 Tax=Tropicimonas sp. IMCC6043 TaxID=2510645 RepID=UPI00101DF443|nr:aldehyde dehydrogenase family protein [Tropicimonas sp. IMCC6043]RYH09590.1 aldehyde dehydrogenase family protein [Tropicimonas sp. IMCC6043]